MQEEAQSEAGEQTLEERVERLVHELGQVINGSEVGRRERLRDKAIHWLRDEIQLTDEVEALPPVREAGFNPFGIGILLLLAGLVLVVLFPPVGLFLFAAAALMMIWGVAFSLLRRGGALTRGD